MKSASIDKIFCLMGPTATGKSAIALRLAEHLPLEVISVDSALVYRGMDIGTAKPTQEERKVCPHHLIDICDPKKFYTAGQFIEDVDRLIVEIRARGKMPLLVGGTMMYFRSLQFGLAALPVRDEAFRRELGQRAEQVGWPALYEELKAVDAKAAQKISPQDKQRISRYLEIHYLTKKKPTEIFLERKRQQQREYVNLAILPEERIQHREVIEKRYITMLEQGLIEEVENLREYYHVNSSHLSQRAVGYRQVWKFMEGKIDRNDLINMGTTATYQLAKRQITWLRSWPNLTSFGSHDKNLLEKILKWIAV